MPGQSKNLSPTIQGMHDNISDDELDNLKEALGKSREKTTKQIEHIKEVLESERS